MATKRTKTASNKTPKKLRPGELEGAFVPFNFKRHVLPPLGGVFIFLLVFGLFNSQWISGQISYRLRQRNHQTDTKIVTITKKVPNPAPIKIPNDAPAVINIPKINVNAPVIYDQTKVDQQAFLQALHDGVVHYPDTALPGQAGNLVIFGHSSGQWWAPGHYKFVFSLLDNVKEKDQISIDYKGIRYVYEVTNKHVVMPDDVSVLSPTSDHKLTLITCTPVGTNKKRLIVEAQQISPSTKDEKTVTTQKIVETKSLPGNSASFWQNVKDLF